MRSLLIGVALAGAMLAASPSLAATNLECIDGGYTPEQEKVFEDYYAGFNVTSLDQESNSDAELGAISSRAGDCAREHGWSTDAILQSVFYRMSKMLAHALELKTPLTSEQMGRLNQAIANADQQRLREILGPGIEASMKGEEGPELSDKDSTYLGLMVVSAGLPAEKSYSEYAGALLGARMMADIAAEKFAKF